MSLFGTIVTLPSMILFYLVWIVASIYRPFFLATIVFALTKPKALLLRLERALLTIQFLLFSKDKKWKQPPEDPESAFLRNEKDEVETKTVIFVRHGESAWNDTFNPGDRSKLSFAFNFVPNLIKALFFEWYFLITGQENQSWFFDSPLSEKGRGQAKNVRKFLAEALDYKTPREGELVRLMLGESPSQMVSSNLRRCISTLAIGFQDRLSTKGDSILILPELQEISINPDALSITAPKGRVPLAWTDPAYLQPFYEKQIDTSLHTGNKDVKSNGLKRMQAFCDVLFDPAVIPKDSAVIIGGHSLWFRSFFRTYLPYQLEHISKKKKLINGGCVGFTFQRIKKQDGGYGYLIDHKTITVLHGGF